MYYYNKKYCYIFEHFEVDASLYRKGKGSFYKRNISMADKQLENETNNLIKNSKIDKNEISALGTTSITTTQEANKINLKENFIRIFDSHYKNINEYKENLGKHPSLKNLNFKTIFIIEQTTEFGGWVYKNNRHTNLELFYCDFVLDKLKSAVNVDYFIFLNKSDDEKCFTIIENGNWSKLTPHIMNYDNEKIFFINNVITITSTVFMSNKKVLTKHPNNRYSI